MTAKTDAFHCPDAQAFLRLLTSPGALVAVRSLHPQQEWHYAPGALPEALAQLERHSGQRPLYACLNPVREGIGDAYAQDEDITALRWLPLDADPVRPAGTAATDDEKAAAAQALDALLDALRPLLPGLDAALVRGDSGNGAHALLRLPDYPPHAEGGGRSHQWHRLKHIHTALCKRFSTGAVKLDTAVMNPSRIWRIPGTRNVKGADTPDRPRRLARLLSVPDPLVPLDILAYEATLTDAFRVAKPPEVGPHVKPQVTDHPEADHAETERREPAGLPPWWTDLITPGERNNAAYRRARWLLNATEGNRNKADAWDELRAWNKVVCRPRLEEYELRQVLESAHKAGDNPEYARPPTPPEEKEGGTDHATPPAAPPKRKTIAERVITARQVGPPPSDLPYMAGPYLNTGVTHWLTGQTGLGKSTFCYNLAGALATGGELWGLPCRKQRVLYLDMESGDLGRQIKMQRLYRDAQPPEDWLFATEPIPLPGELTDFLAYVRAQAVTFVVFDTARRCFQVKDENDNAEVYNRIVPTLDTLKHQGVASLVLGHPAKNGNGSARGAGAQEDAGDVNLSLTMHRGEVTDADGIIKLTITKNRLLGLGHPPLYLRRAGGDRFERVEAQEANRPDPEAEEPAGRQEQCRDAILSLLHRQPNNHATHGEIITAMKRQGYSASTAKRAHTALVADGALLRALASRFPQGGYCLPDPFADGDESDEMA